MYTHVCMFINQIKTLSILKRIPFARLRISLKNGKTIIFILCNFRTGLAKKRSKMQLFGFSGATDEHKIYFFLLF